MSDLKSLPKSKSNLKNVLFFTQIRWNIDLVGLINTAEYNIMTIHIFVNKFIKKFLICGYYKIRSMCLKVCTFYNFIVFISSVAYVSSYQFVSR